MTLKPPFRVFVDFDGTIAESDVVDLILEKHANPKWRLVESLWMQGHIGSRECLRSQMSMVRCTRNDLKLLLRGVKLDPYFLPFLQAARWLEVPVAIVSDGFDFVIRHLLDERYRHAGDLARKLPVHCNRLRWNVTGLHVSFPGGKACAHGCANCKERVIKRLAQPGETVIFVGDGLSDRFAAHAADFVFAKKKLLAYCRSKRLPHRPFDHFNEITQWLEASARVGGAPKTKGTLCHAIV